MTILAFSIMQIGGIHTGQPFFTSSGTVTATLVSPGVYQVNSIQGTLSYNNGSPVQTITGLSAFNNPDQLIYLPPDNSYLTAQFLDRAGMSFTDGTYDYNFESEGTSGPVSGVNQYTQAPDGRVAFSGDFFSVSLAPPSAPVDTDQTANSVTEGAAAGTPVGITASSSDPNGETIYYFLSDGANGPFQIDPFSGVVTVSAAGAIGINYEIGPSHAYNILVEADNGSAISTHTFTIDVNDVAPSTPVDFDASPNVITEGAAAGARVGLTVSSRDVNGGSFTYSLTANPGGFFTIDPNTGVVTVSPAGATGIDYESAPGHSYSITAQASDGTLGTSQNFTIDVNDVAPKTFADAYSVHGNLTLRVGPGAGVLQNDSDVNGGAISAVLGGAPTHAASFSFNGDGSFSYTPVGSFLGSDGFSYRATDGTLTSALTNVTIINVGNTPPITRNDVVTLAAAQNTLTGNVLSNDSDGDGDALRVTSVSDYLNGVQQQVAVPASGTVTLPSTHGVFTIAADGSYSFSANDARPVQNHYAEDPLIYSISDGHGGTATSQLDVNFVGQQRPSTETFNFNFVNSTVTYGGDGQAYLTGPDGVTHNVTGVGLLIFNDGRINESDYTQTTTVGAPPGRIVPAGSALVDDLYYDSQYHDVYLAGVDPEAHYAAFGWHEGRNPDPYFNTNYYLSQNPDVAAAGVNPLTHYDTFGWHEGRNPGPNFNTTDYELANPDVAAAGVDPLTHYLTFGELENRVTFPANAGSDGPVNGFDPAYYLANNPDVAAAHVDPLQHYLTFGWHEGRNPSADFNTNFYESHNPDVAAAGVDPLIHYDQSGWHEGRDPAAVFSTSGYLTTYTDVAAAGLNPLQHFLQSGMAEGRSPSG